MLAHHYGAALDYLRAAGQDASGLAEPARIALAEAGDRAASLVAFGQAAAFYARALELWPANAADRPRLLFRYGRALLYSADGGVEALEEARSGLLEAGDVERAAACELLLAELAWKRARTDRAFELLRRAHGLVADRPPTGAKAHVLSGLSRFHMLASRSDEAIRFGREALALAAELGLRDVEAHALNNIGVARAHRGDLGGLDDLARSIAIAQEIDSPWDVVRGQQNLAALQGELGYLHEMIPLHEAAVATSRRFGLSLRFLAGEIAMDALYEGRWSDALAEADALIADSEAGEPNYIEPLARGARATVRLGRGDTAGALEDLRRGLEIARGAGDPQAVLPALAFSAWLQLNVGNGGGAEQLAEECIALWRSDDGTHYPASEWAVWVAWVLVERGRGAELLDLARAAPVQTRWLAAAVSIASDDFTDAADRLAEIGDRTAEGYARLRAAEAGDLAQLGPRSRSSAVSARSSSSGAPSRFSPRRPKPGYVGSSWPMASSFGTPIDAWMCTRRHRPASRRATPVKRSDTSPPPSGSSIRGSSTTQPRSPDEYARRRADSIRTPAICGACARQASFARCGPSPPLLRIRPMTKYARVVRDQLCRSHPASPASMVR